LSSLSGPAEPTQADTVKNYLDRVRELIPTEVTAAFVAINSLVPFDSDNTTYLYIFFAFLVVACWLYLNRFQGVGSIQQLAFTSLIAFPVWAFNIAMARFDFVADKTFVPAAVLILVTVFAPLFAGRRKQRIA
jgi:hypothetical protein